MSRSVLARFVLALSLVGGVHAQSASPPEVCTYASCRLDLSRSLWGAKITQGEPPRLVYTEGLRIFWERPTEPFDLSQTVASSPEALAFAQSYQRRDRVASLVALVALGAGTGLRVYSHFREGDAAPTERIAGGVATGLFVTAFTLRLRARSQRSRAIDAYNASLPR